MTDSEFATIYPDTTNKQIALLCGCSTVTVLKRAHRLGLRKSTEHKSAMQRANATGRIVSDACKAVLSGKAQGRTWSAETRTKILSNRRPASGEEHYKWNGGKPWKRFKDARYQGWRRAVLERDEYRCQQCGRQCTKSERGLAAHHVQPYAEYENLRYEVSNGVTLCRICHLSLHGRNPKLPTFHPCACGCGTQIASEDRYGRPRRFVNGHGRRRR